MADLSALDRNPNLLDLNDDCLLELFSWLPLLDLCAVRDSSSRLRTLTGYYFTRSDDALDFSSGRIKGNNWGAIKKEELLKVLTSFGRHIDRLTINQDDFTADLPSGCLLAILDAFCNQYHLRQLKLVGFYYNDAFITKDSRSFANVEHLTIDECFSYSYNIDQLIKKCIDLNHLELIRGSYVDGTCLKQKYPLLQKLSIKTCPYIRNVEMFIEENKQLRELSIADCVELNDDILKMVADHLRELESLTLRSVGETPNLKASLWRLTELPKLRELDVDCHYVAVEDFLNGLAVKNQLTSLGLAKVELTEGVLDAIECLTNLQKLKFVEMLDSKASVPFKSFATRVPNIKQLHVDTCDSIEFDDIIELIKNAPKLEDLMISSCKNVAPFDREQFNRLVKVCSKRVNELKLTVHIDCDEYYTTMENIDHNLLESHAKSVKLIELSGMLKDVCAVKVPSGFFAEEGGALDYDYYDDLDFGPADDYDDFDDYDDYGGYGSDS